MSLEKLLAEYASGAGQLQSAVQRVTAEQCSQHPVPGTWSIQEVICHLADYETIYSDRMKRVLAEDNPTLPAACPDAWSAALHYPERCVEEELAVISAVRRQTSRLLTSLDLEDFQRTGVHTEDGPLTLESLLERIVEHIPHHLAFINAKIDALRSVDAESGR